MPTRQVLIVGASGFVASELIRRLRGRAGIRLVAGVRRPETCRFPSDVEVRRVEALEPDTIAEAMRGATHVVDCVMGSPEAMRGAARAVFASALDLGVARVVHLSSIAVYGAVSGPITEDHPLRAEDRYGTAKITCETEARSAIERGLPVVTLRPALVYGPGSPLWSTRIGRLLLSRRLGDLGPAGEGVCDLIHVRDVARAIDAALTRDGVAGRAFNLADPAPPSWNTYLMHFARALRVNPVPSISGWRLVLERGLVSPALCLVEIAAGRIGCADLVPPHIDAGLASLFAQTACFDSGLAEALLDEDRIPWRTGVDEVAATMIV